MREGKREAAFAAGAAKNQDMIYVKEEEEEEAEEEKEGEGRMGQRVGKSKACTVPMLPWSHQRQLF